jgi:hypothetical protein
LNWKIWEHYENGNRDFAKVYTELWQKADIYARYVNRNGGLYLPCQCCGETNKIPCKIG